MKTKMHKEVTVNLASRKDGFKQLKFTQKDYEIALKVLEQINGESAYGCNPDMCLSTYKVIELLKWTGTKL